MATKTFKIGLSNAEKQAMAQDVYERLLALTFPEYDTSTSYSVGDFVVYNDQLYKCIGATSGAWDSSKWQLATLNDLLTDIESAVAFVNDKANVDGNYPTMTVGVADNLSPYDETSGINQHAPFNFQASGTNNGKDSTAAVGAIALMREKRGNTVVVNQLVRNPNFENTSNWTVNNATFTVSNNKAIVTISDANNPSGIYQIVGGTIGHTLLIISTIQPQYAGTILVAYEQSSYVQYNFSANETKNIFQLVNHIGGNGSLAFYAGFGGQSVNDTFEISNVFIVDLTQWFNGDIPQDLLDNPENFFRYYQGSLAYNEGTLVNANSRYLKAWGRQQWDGEYTDGYVINVGGVNTYDNTSFFYTSYIRVNPNTTYYFKGGVAGGSGKYGVFFYDINKNPDGAEGHFPNSHDGTFTTGANTFFIRCNCQKSYGQPNEVCISLYYEDEGGYDKHYPYELLTDNDTGTETLRSAGSAYDIKLPSGEIKRNVGTYTFTGDEVWTVGTYGYYAGLLSNYAKEIGYGYKANISSDTGLIATSRGNIVDGVVNDGISATNNLIYVSNTTGLAGKTIYYELAEPTTEQGTPYSENIAIDDFGSMSFEGTSGVPQGNALFYPVDYKAFIDTLHNVTDGDPDNLALKSDLTDLVAQEDLSSEITEVAAGLTYVIKKAYKTGNVVNLTIDVENNTGSAINENTTLFAIGGDLLPIPSQLNFIGYYAGEGNVCRVQINKSGQAGNVSINKQFEYAARLTILVSYAVA